MDFYYIKHVDDEAHQRTRHKYVYLKYDTFCKGVSDC